MFAAAALFLVYPAIVAVATLLGASFELNFMDFGAYYSAAGRFLEGGSLYYTPSRPAAPSHPGGVFPYLYPPVVIVPFIPLALLPFWVAAGIWVTVSLAVAVFGAKTLLNAYDIRLSRAKMLLLAYGIFAFAPTLIWFKLGQVTGMFVGSLCFAAASLERNPDGRFGWLGLALLPAVVKPPYAVTMAPALNDYQRVLRVVILGIAVIAVSVLLFGIEAHEAYLGVLREGKGWHLDALPISKFSFFVFRPFHVLGSARIVLRGVLLVALVGYVLERRSRRPRVERALFALGCAAVPVLHPTVNTLTLNALIPAYLIVFVSEFRRSDGALTIPLLSLVLVQIHPYATSVLSWIGIGALSPLDPLTPLVPVLQPGLWGIVSLVAFIVYRIERDEGGFPLPEDGSVR
ncbi:glycosyltransferase family 87 protein [Halobacterium hubeiense]|uniref:glycosyltransferase family 87 protein n=1 Tax=Halobacterium hubeiense TaxID=1407499 RepID=UPI00073E88C6|nr:glycosyltransferase family 87 protein [Halobacterium hubeiense]